MNFSPEASGTRASGENVGELFSFKLVFREPPSSIKSYSMLTISPLQTALLISSYTNFLLVGTQANRQVL